MKKSPEDAGEQSSSTGAGPLTNLANSLTLTQPAKNESKTRAAPSSSKTRLRKDNFVVYKDLDESPIKAPMKVERHRGISKEDAEQLEHLINITKVAKEPMKEEEREETPKKAVRKVKLNRSKAFLVKDRADKSPAKVAVHLRVPLTDRNYSFRNRDDIKAKELFY